MTGARVRPLLNLADVLGRFGVDAIELDEELVAHRLGEDREEVGAIVGRHLAGDVRDRLGRHALDELFLLVLVEALEDVGGLPGGELLEDLRDLVRLELAQDVGEILGVDLFEQLAHLIRILLEDLLHIRSEECAEPHGAVFL